MFTSAIATETGTTTSYQAPFMTSEFFKALRKIDYEGYVGLDIYPLQDPFGEVRKSKEYIDEMYAKLAKQP